MPEGRPEDYLKGRRKRGAPSKEKAREIMHDGTAHGHMLTDKQRGFMGAIASGKSRRRRKRG